MIGNPDSAEGLSIKRLRSEPSSRGITIVSAQPIDSCAESSITVTADSFMIVVGRYWKIADRRKSLVPGEDNMLAGRLTRLYLLSDLLPDTALLFGLLSSQVLIQKSNVRL